MSKTKIEIPWYGDGREARDAVSKHGLKLVKGTHETSHGEYVIVVSGDSQKLIKFLTGDDYDLPLKDVKAGWPELFEGVRMKKSELKKLIRECLIREASESTALEGSDLKQYQKVITRSIKDWEYELEQNKQYAAKPDLSKAQVKYSKKLVDATQESLSLLKKLNISSAKTYADVARAFETLDDDAQRELGLSTQLHNKLVRLGGWKE